MVTSATALGVDTCARSPSNTSRSAEAHISPEAEEPSAAVTTVDAVGLDAAETTRLASRAVIQKTYLNEFRHTYYVKRGNGSAPRGLLRDAGLLWQGDAVPALCLHMIVIA